MVGIANMSAGPPAKRFASSSAADIDSLRNAATAVNTVRSTGTWLRVFQRWAESQEPALSPDIETHPPTSLNKHLEKFYSDVRQSDGSEYDPESFRVMIAALDRHLKAKDYPASINTSREFVSSKSVLEGKCRLLRKSGGGKRRNRAQSLTDEEENILWDCGQLGALTPNSLKQTVWWLTTQHLGLRGRELHHDLSVEDLVKGVDNAKRPYYKYVEPTTKSRPKGLHHKHRLVDAKLYATGGERCPYALFELYKSKRPSNMQESGPMYMQSLRRPSNDVWYSAKVQDGVNTIGNFMQRMKKNSPLAEICPNKKLTGHSGRKTVVRKLKSSKFSRDQIIQVTGHAGTSGLDPYDSGNEDEMAAMSAAIDRTAPTTIENTITNEVAPPIDETYNQAVPSESFMFGLPWNSVTGQNTPLQVEVQPIGASSIQAQNVYILTNCPDVRIGAEKRKMVIISSQESQ